jgi:putative intracellular protease/amidase
MKKVLLFLSQGFEKAETAAFIDVFGWSRVVKGVEPIELVVVGLEDEIKATHNLVVRPQKLKLDEFSAFCLPG